jgi:hypothetical protein
VRRIEFAKWTPELPWGDGGPLPGANDGRILPPVAHDRVGAGQLLEGLAGAGRVQLGFAGLFAEVVRVRCLWQPRHEWALSPVATDPSTERGTSRPKDAGAPRPGGRPAKKNLPDWSILCCPKPKNAFNAARGRVPARDPEVRTDSRPSSVGYLCG